jgi:hypothetical protein
MFNGPLQFNKYSTETPNIEIPTGPQPPSTDECDRLKAAVKVTWSSNVIRARVLMAITGYYTTVSRRPNVARTPWCDANNDGPEFFWSTSCIWAFFTKFCPVVFWENFPKNAQP